MRAASALLLLSACTTEGSLGSTQPNNGLVQVAKWSATAPTALDLVVVLDDSLGMQPIHDSLASSIPAFVASLGALSTGLPDLHIAVVSSDMGTKALLDPQWGGDVGVIGQGGCGVAGKNGAFATSPLVTGSWITDVANAGGRETNYAGTLADAFASLTHLGEGGCGFEQPLHAAEVAFGKPEHAGFLRSHARLGVIVIGNEDDCSAARAEFFNADSQTPALGPLHSFRCTRFGVTCEHGGRTTDEMNQLGPKQNCHANESLSYLTSVRDHVAAIAALKPDPRDIFFGAIAAESSSLEVELQMPPAGGVVTPALKAQCRGADSGPAGWSDILPAVRLTDAAKGFLNGRVSTMCGGSVEAPLLDMARELRSLVHDACLTRDIQLPADCEAFDTFADGSSRPMRACGSGTGDCWQLVSDPGCPGQQKRLDVNRVGGAPPDARVSLRCRL